MGPQRAAKDATVVPANFYFLCFFQSQGIGELPDGADFSFLLSGAGEQSGMSGSR